MIDILKFLGIILMVVFFMWLCIFMGRMMVATDTWIEMGCDETAKCIVRVEDNHG